MQHGEQHGIPSATLPDKQAREATPPPVLQRGRHRVQRPAAPLEQTVLMTLAAGSTHGLGRGERCEPSVAAEGREACAALDLPLQRGVGRLVRAWYKHGACIMV